MNRTIGNHYFINFKNNAQQETWEADGPAWSKEDLLSIANKFFRDHPDGLILIEKPKANRMYEEHAVIHNTEEAGLFNF